MKLSNRPKLIRSLSVILMLFVQGVVLAQAVTQAEYFFDTDPGVGKGTALPLSAGAAVEINTDVPVGELSPGFHSLHVRVRDSGGKWSLFESRNFTVEPSAPSAQAVTQAEYFFDTDPGVGKGTALPLTAGGTVNVTRELELAGLQPGFHTLLMRTKDNNGVWSLSEGRPFLVEQTGSGANAVISIVEYFFDNENPAPGQGRQFSVTPAREISLQPDVPVGSLALGSHRITVRARDNLGNWGAVEWRDFSVANPRLDKIMPASGGNIGDVTVNILGASFDKGTQMKLTRSGKPDIVVPDSLVSIVNGEQIVATLDLREKEIGDYNVVVTLQNGSTLNLPNGFKIVAGIKAEPWAKIIGFDRIRGGQWQKYTISYGNKGNVDALATPLWVAIPINAEIQYDFGIYNPDSLSNRFDTIPPFIEIDSLFEQPFKAKLTPLIIPVIPGGAVNALSIKIKVPLNASSQFQIIAWVNKPMLNSLRVEKNKGGRVSETPERTNDRIDCYAEIVTTILGLIPVVGCAVEIGDLGVRPLLKAWFSGDNGLSIKEGARKGKFDVGSLSWNIIKAGVGCIPAAKLTIFSALALTKMVRRGSFMSNLRKVQRLEKSSSDISNLTKLVGCAESHNPEEKKITPVASFDPNDKLGPIGSGAKSYITGSPSNSFEYLIRFENKVTATAAAQTVIIVDTLDKSRFDLSTLQLGFFNFADKYVNVPAGRQNYTAEVDLRPATDLVVKIEAKLDSVKGILTWRFTSLDPKTRKPTDDPDAGFLPPNKTAPQGDGGVFFTVRPKKELTTNLAVKNKAYIFFDNNEVIPTPVWANTIDKAIPQSTVKPLQQVQSDSTFTVGWSGTDEGSGIATYSVFVSANNKPYELWIDGTSSTSAKFTGRFDSTYRFYSIAQDSAGNVEMLPTTHDAITKIQKVTGIEDNLANKIKLYPIPTNDLLRVEIPPVIKWESIQISTLQGRPLLFRKNRQNGPIELSLKGWSMGVYIVEIKSQQGTFHKKIIIN